jgi:hypothetical protein
MQPGQHPDAIDTRLVLRIYAWIVTATGLAFMDGFPFFLTHTPADYDLLDIPWGRVGVVRVAGAAAAALGFAAVGLSRIENPSTGAAPSSGSPSATSSPAWSSPLPQLRFSGVSCHP